MHSATHIRTTMEIAFMQICAINTRAPDMGRIHSCQKERVAKTNIRSSQMHNKYHEQINNNKAKSLVAGQRRNTTLYGVLEDDNANKYRQGVIKIYFT